VYGEEMSMAALTMTRGTYLDRVYGGWLGKSAGGTLGTPLEGKKQTFNLHFYDPRPGQALWNEDLDFQLVALAAVREHGPDTTSEQLAQAWLDHIAYRWDEYGYALYNIRRGLTPPISGAFNNWFRQSDGGAIRTELWAMIAPGAPQVAAEYAYRDASIDHAQEGVWSAMARASMQSAAFFVTDVNALLDVALAMVPAASRTARAIRAARDGWRNRSTWLECRARVLEAAGTENVTDAAQNMGFMAIGLLYGAGDFGASLCAAANCGYDADGNAGAVGATLGIMRGKAGLPQDWLAPIGDSVVLGWGVVNLEVERLTAELAAHTVEAGEKVIAARCPELELTDGDAIPWDVPPQAPAPTEIGDPSQPEEAGEPPKANGFAMPDLSGEPAPDSTTVAVGRAAFIEIDAPLGEQTQMPPESPEVAPAPATPGDTVEELGAKLEPAPTDSAAGAVAEPPAGEPTLGEPMTEAVAPAITPAVEPAPPPAPTPVAEAPVAAPSPTLAFLDNSAIKPLLVAPVNSAVCRAGMFEITVDYGETGPALIPNQATSFTVEIRNTAAQDFMGHVTLCVPTGWQVAVPGAQGQRQMLAPGGMARYGFVVRVPEGVPLAAKNTVTVVLTPEQGAATTCDVNFLAGTCWWFVGPFANMNEEGFYKAYPVEDRPDFQDTYLGRAGGMLTWQKLAFRENVMELEPLFGGTAGVAYGVTTVHVSAPTEARFVIHTNDGFRLWLNKRPVLQRHSHEPFLPTLGYGPGQVDVALQAGDNQVMLKVVRCREPLAFSFAIVDRKGDPLLDVIASKWG
jgi:ADP-ribosylglycohydrolase